MAKEIMKLNFIGNDPRVYDYYLGCFGYGKQRQPMIPYHREFTDSEKEFFNKTSYEDARKSSLYREIMNSAECKKYVSQFNLDKKQITVKKNWDEQKEKINCFIVNQLKLDNLDMHPVDVVMSTQPGSYSRELDEKFIRWGHPRSEEDPFYDGRYLFHEWFHAVEDKFDLPNLEQSHALLELADTYLYEKILGGKKDYGEGHEELGKMREKIKPYFVEFLTEHGNAKNFLELREHMVKKFKC